MTTIQARRIAGTSDVILSIAATYPTGQLRDATGWLLGRRVRQNMTFLVVAPATASSVLTVREMVAGMRDDGLPVSAIAEMARVERKSVYSWIDGGDVRDDNQFRVSELYRILHRDRQADFRSLYRLWARPLDGGATLRSLLSADVLDEAAIRQALDLLWPIARKHMGDARHLGSASTRRSNPLLSAVPEAGRLSDR